MQIENILTDLVDELAKALPSDLAKTALNSVLRRRRERAAALLLVEIRRGKIPLQPPDEAISAILRYMRAADEGAARLNLRLMARVLAGKAFLDDLKADEFLYYADMLASMRREEIVLIATMHRVRHQNTEIEGRREPHQQWELIASALVPQTFSNENALRAAVTACLRTGLLTDENTIDNSGWYTTSSLMDELERLAPFEAALEEESL